MPFSNELTGASGSYAVGGQTINYTAVATGGNLDSYGAGFGGIDGTNYYLGNASESPEAYSQNFDQTIAELQINANAQNTFGSLISPSTALM